MRDNQIRFAIFKRLRSPGPAFRRWRDCYPVRRYGSKIQTCRFKLSNTRFAVVAEGLYDRKIQFIAAGNVYYTRPKELTCLLKAAEKAGICLDHSTINKSTNPRIVRVASANKDESGVRK